MRPSQRLDLIIRLADELQSRYTFNDIDVYLNAHGIETPLPYDGFPDRAAYAKRYLGQVTDQFRLFISHISSEKDKAARLKECLAPYAISGFVAHEDIHPTLEWQQQI